MHMPALETERLIVRPFVADDLDVVQRILNEAFRTDVTLDERREWLRWSAMNEVQLAQLYQPPYGDRAVVLKQTGQLVGAVGYVPLLAPFGRLPGFPAAGGAYATEFGMFWATDPAQQRRGYAGEAAQAMLGYAFRQLRLARVLAMTAFENVASQAVMRALGMRLLRNPLPEPHWLQVVGVLDNADV